GDRTRAAPQRRVALRASGGELAGQPMRLPRLPLVTALALLFFFAYITGIRLAYSLLYALVLLFAVSYLCSRLSSDNLDGVPATPLGSSLGRCESPAASRSWCTP